MGWQGKSLSERIPPLIFGTAVFNIQYNKDPQALRPTALVQRALAHGIRGFDTSPYYGAAEQILGSALASNLIRPNYRREEYLILTKIGRVAASTFDYSPAWIRRSVERSCRRLQTSYLDVVYCHDVEFVSPVEVLLAINELRRIRDEEGTIHYVGISGYPVQILCELAEMILRETGEPLDAVMSYSNFTLQNTKLLTEGLSRLAAAGVDVVPNASPLSMGLLRQRGPPIGALGDWHPAPNELRYACMAASGWAAQQGEKLEKVAVRFAMENWLREASKAGTRVNPLITMGESYQSYSQDQDKFGVSVIGVSSVDELDETMKIWHSVLDGLADDLDAPPGTITPNDALSDHEWSLRRRQNIRQLAAGVRTVLGEWVDFTWPSPGPGFVNQRHVSDEDEDQEMALKPNDEVEGMMTPPIADDDHN